MKLRLFALLLALLMMLSACAPAQQSSESEEPGSAASEVQQESAQGEAPSSAVAGEGDMAAPVEIDTEGLAPVGAEMLQDGSYEIAVDCSSSMFRITGCTLTVENGTLTARLDMSSATYLYLYPGSAQQAAEAAEDALIPYEENADGTHSFTIPVSALNVPVDCAAYSGRKEMWYDRTLLFRSDSLPIDAYAEGSLVTLESLSLGDGDYTAEVTLTGGSGRASVESPVSLHVEDGSCTARIVWSSANYDYMILDGEKLLPLEGEETSVFLLPITIFDFPVSVIADTTAMSTPHEVAYTLTFHADTITPAS